MQSSQFSRITDELLSAYLDDDLSYRERELVEAAIEADAEVAWRLESLRQTVRLLNNLPEIVPKRSFLLNESMVGDVIRARRQAAARRRQAMSRGSAAVASRTAPDEAVESGSWWAHLGRNWRAFWHGGNPVLRNLATASLVLALFIAGADTLLTQPVSPAAPEMFVLEQESVAPAQAPEAASLAAPREDAVASAEDAPPMEAMRAAEMPADGMELAAVDEDAAEGAQEDTEEMATAAMVAPELATPAVVEGEEGEAVTLDAEVETLALAVPEEESDEGGFGDAAAPGLLHSEPGMGGGPDEIGGFGGGGDNGAGPVMPMPLGEPEGEPFFFDEEEAVALDETPLDDTAAAEIAAEEPVADAGELEPAPEARVAMVEEPAEESAEDTGAEETDAEDADSETAARIAIVPTQTAPDREAAPSAAEAVPDAEMELAVEDAVTTDAVTTDMALDDKGAENDVAAEDGADRARVAEVEPEPEAEVDTGAVLAVEESTVGAQEPAGARVLNWLQWGLLMVAAAFSALWWRSRS